MSSRLLLGLVVCAALFIGGCEAMDNFVGDDPATPAVESANPPLEKQVTDTGTLWSPVTGGASGAAALVIVGIIQLYRKLRRAQKAVKEIQLNPAIGEVLEMVSTPESKAEILTILRDDLKAGA